MTLNICCVFSPLLPVPCPPQNVSASLVCLNHSALVTWARSPGAVRYTVTMEGQGAHTRQCQTNSTSCQVAGIRCGEVYNVTVTPYSETCAGQPSECYTFKAGAEGVETRYSKCRKRTGVRTLNPLFLPLPTGLCAPSITEATTACEYSNVTWTPVPGAEMFVVTATADDGHTQTCSSNLSLSCNFTDLRCGKTYNVTVVTVDRGCWSEPSMAVELKTGEE